MSKVLQYSFDEIKVASAISLPIFTQLRLFPKWILHFFRSFFTRNRVRARTVSFSNVAPLSRHILIFLLRDPFTRENSQIRQPNQTWPCGQRPRLSPFMLISLIRYFHDFRTSQACHIYRLVYLRYAGRADEPNEISPAKGDN